MITVKIPSMKNQIEEFLIEDDLTRNSLYQERLPRTLVECQLKFKSDLTIAGLIFFKDVFHYFDSSINLTNILEFEGKSVLKSENLVLKFKAPFHIALNSERVALNLLQKASAVATQTKKFVDIAKTKNIKILDTRKTTPGLRSLEKYAVVVGGGYNHRFGQNDSFMIKDNHKVIMGGVKPAVDFFKNMNGFYTPLILEIHNFEEFKVASELGIKHFLLDNFSSSDIKKLISMKKEQMTFEVSGGVNLNNISDYLIDGVDAISIGSITNNPPPVDISMKMVKL